MYIRCMCKDSWKGKIDLRDGRTDKNLTFPFWPTTIILSNNDNNKLKKKSHDHEGVSLRQTIDGFQFFGQKYDQKDQ